MADISTEIQFILRTRHPYRHFTVREFSANTTPTVSSVVTEE